jgi:hypothetical protein
MAFPDSRRPSASKGGISAMLNVQVIIDKLAQLDKKVKSD